MSLFAPNLYLPDGVGAHHGHADAPALDDVRTAGPAPFVPRPYQEAAAAAVLKAFESSRSTLVVSATGTGKTCLFALLTQRMAGRSMILAHRDELIDQACSKVEHITGERPDIEKAGDYADIRRRRAKVVVSSVQTQNAGMGGKGRMTRFDPGDFDLLIVDEAHRAVAKSYRRAIDYYMAGNPNLKLLGVTATPDRGDAQALGKVFETVAFRFPIYDAIEQGWLVPIRQLSVTVKDLDLSRVRTKCGDLHGAELDAILRFESVLLGMATPLIELSRGRQTLVFCASVAHAERFAEMLSERYGASARFVCGETPKLERKQLFRDFGRRRFQFLCNVGVATEGTDIPGVEVVAMARPTKSRALFEQMVGRGTRTLPGVVDGPETPELRRAAIEASEKQYCEVVDFVGNAGKHKLITVADVLGGKYDEETRARAAKKAAASAKSGVPADVAELLKASDREILAAKARKLEAEKAEAEKRKHIVAQSAYRAQEINPFDLYDVKPPRECKWDKAPRPTEKQIEFLKQRNIDVTKSTKGEAGRLISAMMGRVTPGQAKVLTRAGYQTSEIRSLSVADASRLIDAVRNNGWKRLPTNNPTEAA